MSADLSVMFPIWILVQNFSLHIYGHMNDEEPQDFPNKDTCMQLLIFSLNRNKLFNELILCCQCLRKMYKQYLLLIFLDTRALCFFTLPKLPLEFILLTILQLKNAQCECQGCFEILRSLNFQLLFSENIPRQGNPGSLCLTKGEWLEEFCTQRARVWI